jgi:hypothetical protein
VSDEGLQSVIDYYVAHPKPIEPGTEYYLQRRSTKLDQMWSDFLTGGHGFDPRYTSQ